MEKPLESLPPPEGKRSTQRVTDKVPNWQKQERLEETQRENKAHIQSVPHPNDYSSKCQITKN